MNQENTEISEEAKKKVLQLFLDNKLQINPDIKVSQVSVVFRDDLENDIAWFGYGNSEEMFQDLDALYPNCEQVKKIIQDTFGDDRLSLRVYLETSGLVGNTIKLSKDSE